MRRRFRRLNCVRASLPLVRHAFSPGAKVRTKPRPPIPWARFLWTRGYLRWHIFFVVHERTRRSASLPLVRHTFPPGVTARTKMRHAFPVIPLLPVIPISLIPKIPVIPAQMRFSSAQRRGRKCVMLSLLSLFSLSSLKSLLSQPRGRRRQRMTRRRRALPLPWRGSFGRFALLPYLGTTPAHRPINIMPHSTKNAPP